jgi:hypothetical protein
VRHIKSFCREYAEVVEQYLRIDIWIGRISVLFLAMTLSALTRAIDSPQMAAAFNDDLRPPAY